MQLTIKRREDTLSDPARFAQPCGPRLRCPLTLSARPGRRYCRSFVDGSMSCLLHGDRRGGPLGTCLDNLGREVRSGRCCLPGGGIWPNVCLWVEGPLAATGEIGREGLQKLTAKTVRPSPWRPMFPTPSRSRQVVDAAVREYGRIDPRGPWPVKTATESGTEPDVAKRLRKFYADVAIPAESFARAVAFAVGQPEEVDINEILFRPTRQEL